MRYILFAVAALLLAGAVPAQAKVEEGDVAPDFAVRLFDGSTKRLADYKGKVLVINYWATWCAPCKAEMPMMDAFHGLYTKHGFEILGVLTQDRISKKRLRPLAEKMSYQLATWKSGKYGPVKNSLPTPYVIDRKGKVRHVKVGSFTAQEFIDMMIPLLRESA